MGRDGGTTEGVFSHIVVGGGLSGALICRALQRDSARDWMLLEARSVLGGRLANDEGDRIDMGGAWIWPDHQPHVRELVVELGLETFPQPDDPSSVRIDGGAVQIVHRIASNLDTSRVRLNTPVKSCRLEPVQGETLIRLEAVDGQAFLSRRVILAVPPKLIDKHIAFDPPLSLPKRSAMRACNTWMAGVTKVALVYPQRFWRHYSNMGLGGFPAFQVYDGSTRNGSTAALTFFTVATNVPNDRQLAQQVAGQMRHRWLRFGYEDMARRADSYCSYHVQRWPGETYISEDASPRCVQPHPVPVPELAAQDWNGALLFAGSESDLHSPGVMEGAVRAAKRAIRELGIFDLESTQ